MPVDSAKLAELTSAKLDELQPDVWISLGVAPGLAVVAVETVSGILLTKLIDKDVLAKVFGVERAPLAYLHLFLVAPILLFPVAHVTVHWLDGRSRRVLSIFRPHVYPRRPSMAAIMVKLREENARLRKEKVNYDSNR